MPLFVWNAQQLGSGQPAVWQWFVQSVQEWHAKVHTSNENAIRGCNLFVIMIL